SARVAASQRLGIPLGARGEAAVELLDPLEIGLGERARRDDTFIEHRTELGDRRLIKPEVSLTFHDGNATRLRPGRYAERPSQYHRVRGGSPSAGGSPEHDRAGGTRTSARGDMVPRRPARLPHSLHRLDPFSIPRCPPSEPLAPSDAPDL